MKSFNEHSVLKEQTKNAGLGVYPASGFALFKMRMRTFANLFAALKGVLLIRPLVLLLCSFIIWGLVFGTSLAGFNFLKAQNFLWVVALSAFCLTCFFYRLVLCSYFPPE